jgi:hypothetical protein
LYVYVSLALNGGWFTRQFYHNPVHVPSTGYEKLAKTPTSLHKLVGDRCPRGLNLS